MQKGVEISFRGLEPTDAIRADIADKVKKLELLYDHITGCSVIIEAAQHRHHKGNLYHVRVDVTVPDQELVVSHGHDEAHQHEDLYVAIRDAFKAMNRKVEDYARKRRGKVKSHETPPHGRIAMLAPDEDYGKIITADNREVYFHRNSVVDTDFDKLNVGDEVRFSEELGERGPQATGVHAIGKHHVVG